MPPSLRPATAEMRPLIAADPMLRAPRPEMVSESTVTGLFDGATGVPAASGAGGRPEEDRLEEREHRGVGAEAEA